MPTENDILKLYLRQITEYPLLSIEEELRLTTKIFEQKKHVQKLTYNSGAEKVTSEMLEKAAQALLISKNQMIHSNLRLVVSIAKKLNNRGLPLLDIINEGNIGLIEAVERFDHRRGCRFSTYGTWWIRQTILKSVAEKSRTVRIPIHMINSMQKYHCTCSYLSEEFEREPTNDEIAQYLQCTPEKVLKIKMASQKTTSLDSTIDDNNMTSLVDMIGDFNKQEPLDQIFRRAVVNDLRRMLDKLPERERRILQLRFGLNGEGPFTLDETGRRVGITRERVRQIQKNTLTYLQDLLRLRGYQENTI
ncbi:MAG: sigma-70 family RNA polymerase sigma factor [Salinispira sp.]